MWPQPSVALAYQVGHVSPEARLLTAICGVALFGWSLLKLRRRSALVPTCSLFLTIGVIFICFAAAPNSFDRLSYTLGIKYPPVLYLIGCIFALILMIVHLASRLAVTDERCRRLAQEFAILQAGIADAHTARQATSNDVARLGVAIARGDGATINRRSDVNSPRTYPHQTRVHRSLQTGDGRECSEQCERTGHSPL